MPKNKKNAKAAASADRAGTDDDSSSVTSAADTLAASEADMAESETPEDKLAEAVELMEEKRAANRHKGLKHFVHILQRHVLREYLCSRVETTISVLLAALKKGTVEDVSRACEGLALVFLTAAPDESTYDGISRHLYKIATGHKHQQAIDALRCLAITRHVASACAEAATALLQTCEGIARAVDTTEKLRAAAFEVWAYTASTITPEIVVSRLYPRFAPVLCSALHHPSIDVRIAAGTCIALVFDLRNLLVGTGDETEETVVTHGGVSTERGAADVGEDVWVDEHADVYGAEQSDDESGTEASGVWDWRNHIPVDFDSLNSGLEADDSLLGRIDEEIRTIVGGLTKESNKRKSKADRKQQRAHFRDILWTVEYGEPVFTEIRFRTAATTLEGWPRKVQFDFIRSYVRTGLDKHLEVNAVLNSLLGIASLSRAGSRFTKEDKAWLVGAKADMKQQRATDRANRYRQKQAFMNADEP